VGKEVAANQVSGGACIIDLAASIGSFVQTHYGVILTIAAIGVLFIPGADLADLAAAAAIGLTARVANRSTNDGQSPFSSQNLGQNLADTIITVGTLGSVSGPASEAEPVIGKLATAGGAALRIRLAIPDLAGLGIDVGTQK
jgi:hypothetical protein